MAGTGIARTMRGVAVTVAGAGLIAVAVVAGSAWAVPAPAVSIEYGEPVAMGAGSARVYLELRDGVPVEMGITMTEDALEGLPGHHSPGGIELEPGHAMFFSTPGMPRNNPTPYRSVLLGWNPGGHEPPGVYDLPHFDFHFYTISNEERLAIDGADPEFEAKANRHPAAERMPAGYIAIPGGVPQMGAHWVDPTTPELNGKTFTETFLFGSWNGEPIFVEPMITKAFLETRAAHYERIPIPAQASGWQPAAYRVYFDDGAREFRIALVDFVLQ